MPDAATATLRLIVSDDRGAPSPFRVEWRQPDAWIQRFWSDDGTAELTARPGPISVLVRRGINYDAVATELDLPAGQVAMHKVALRRRFDPKAMGWYGGENHLHVLHGANDPPRTIADGGRMAAADGLDYVQLAYAWDRSFEWLPTEELERQCRAATSP